MPGSYHETIVVNKSLSLTGVADGDHYPHVGQYQAPVAITISAPDVVLDGFDPYGAGEHAIEVTGDNVTVRNIIASIHRPEHGIDAIISAQGVTGIDIRDCMLESSGQVGINLSDCQGVRITGNDILVNSTPDPEDWEQPRAIHVEFQTSGTYTDYLLDNNTITGGPVLIPLGSFYGEGVNYSDISNVSVTGNRVQGQSVWRS